MIPRSEKIGDIHDTQGFPSKLTRKSSVAIRASAKHKYVAKNL
jgi:hypothetical protein